MFSGLGSLASLSASHRPSCEVRRLPALVGGGPPAHPPTCHAARLPPAWNPQVRACFGQLQESYGGQRIAEGVPPDATVHPLCASTVAALKRLLGYESALRVLFGGELSAGGQAGGRHTAGRRAGRRAAACLLFSPSQCSSHDLRACAVMFEGLRQ